MGASTVEDRTGARPRWGSTARATGAINWKRWHFAEQGLADGGGGRPDGPTVRDTGGGTRPYGPTRREGEPWRCTAGAYVCVRVGYDCSSPKASFCDP